MNSLPTANVQTPCSNFRAGMILEYAKMVAGMMQVEDPNDNTLGYVNASLKAFQNPATPPTQEEFRRFREVIDNLVSGKHSYPSAEFEAYRVAMRPIFEYGPGENAAPLKKKRREDRAE